MAGRALLASSGERPGLLVIPQSAQDGSLLRRISQFKGRKYDLELSVKSWSHEKDTDASGDSTRNV